MQRRADRRVTLRVPGRSLRRRGFTLIEILVATMILTLGLVGILALFPVAIQAGRRVIEDSNAAVIAQSVAESVRSGIRTRKGFARKGSIYFVLNHDGVTDSVPADPRLAKPSADYFILLPRYKKQRRYAGSSERERRVKALREGKTFVYPETDTRRNPNGSGDAYRADNDGDDLKVRIGRKTIETYKVLDVYRLGNHLVPVGKGGRKKGAEYVLDDMVIETLKQYSFAIAVRPSYFDADMAEGKSFEPANQLYHITVIVYRGFPRERLDADQVSPAPVYELEFEVSL